MLLMGRYLFVCLLILVHFFFICALIHELFIIQKMRASVLEVQSPRVIRICFGRDLLISHYARKLSSFEYSDKFDSAKKTWLNIHATISVQFTYSLKYHSTKPSQFFANPFETSFNLTKEEDNESSCTPKPGSCSWSM